MKITVCGSIKFYNDMLEVRERLEELGHDVVLPPSKIVGRNGKEIAAGDYYKVRKSGSDAEWIWERKNQVMRDFFKEIENCDAILVLNKEKNGIEGYIGGNTLMEMGLAMHLGKEIFLMNKVPEMKYKEEILGTKPVVVYGDLERIR